MIEEYAQQEMRWKVLLVTFHSDISLGLFIRPEDGDNMFLLNVSWLSEDQTALHPKDKTHQQAFLCMTWFLCFIM
jgi:hypothetical protein